MYVFIQSSCFFLFFLFSFFYVFTHLAVFQPFLSPFPPYLSLFPCYLCLAEITAARDCRKGLCCKPEYSLAVSSSPLWGARRAQLAAQNSPFSWRVKGSEKNTHTHTHPDYIKSTAVIAVHIGKTQPYTSKYLWLQCWKSVSFVFNSKSVLAQAVIDGKYIRHTVSHFKT